jgi:hypothetical protein
MIYTERTVTIKNFNASIDNVIILYRGDKNVELRFKLIDSKFKFTSTKGNVIDNTQAAYGQLAVMTPLNTSIIISDISECIDGMVTFVMTADMMDELVEIGKYTFQIRLFNDDQSSRITLPPVYDGIEVKQPLIYEEDEVIE